MADPTLSCPACAAMYRPETPPDDRTAAEILAEFDALQAARGVAVFRPMSDPYRLRPETPPGGHETPGKRPDVPQGRNGTPTAERRTAE